MQLVYCIIMMIKLFVELRNGYLSLACMVHFPFNHMNELELSYNCAKRHVKAWGRFVSAVI